MQKIEEPKYTQTPNVLFDELMRSMGLAELKVVLCIYRDTFGWHRDASKISIRKIASITGLSPKGVMDGAKEAEKRGLIKRTVLSTNTTIWETVLVSNTDYAPKVHSTVQVGRGKPGLKKVKERIKEKEIKEAPKAKPKNPPPPEVSLFREVTERFPPKVNFQGVVDSVSKVRERLGRGVMADDLKPFYAAWCHKGYKPINLSWLEWAETGEIPVNGNWKPKRDLIQERYGGLMEWAKENNYDNSAGNDQNFGGIDSGLPKLEAGQIDDASIFRPSTGYSAR